ncbi:MAG: response regulator [Lachnospiraceae bacterium]|nr:response regulator [Lachnospiraceae bacterium]
MKYKVLLTGKNDSAIDDFFIQMTDNFEVLTTSTRFEDIVRHMTYFSPDIFVYCLNNESRDDMIQIANFKFRLSQANIPLVIIGLKEDCDEFEKIAVNAANLTLHRPLSVGAIQERMITLMKDRRFMEVVDTQHAAAEEAKEKAEASVTGEPMRTKPQQLQRRHVLVVDDNAMMLKVLKEHLHGKYDVATAVSGKVALKFLERKKTDLILLDYEMPEESGPAVLEKLRSSDETKDIPVIFLTGVTETKKIKEALALKPQNYLLKPIDREKLLDTIAKEIG